MIHKNAIFRRVRLSSPASFRAGFPLGLARNRSIPSIVAWTCVSSQTTPRRRRRDLSQRSSEVIDEGEERCREIRAKAARGGWKIRKRNSRSSMNIASRAVVSMSDVGRNISRRERLLNYSRRVSLPGPGSAIVEAPISRTPPHLTRRAFTSRGDFMIAVSLSTYAGITLFGIELRAPAPNTGCSARTSALLARDF